LSSTWSSLLVGPWTKCFIWLIELFISKISIWFFQNFYLYWISVSCYTLFLISFICLFISTLSSLIILIIILLILFLKFYQLHYHCNHCGIVNFWRHHVALFFSYFLYFHIEIYMTEAEPLCASFNLP
jgi:hypothetical protein